MRYYKIAITDATSGVLFQPPGFTGLLGDASYTSFVNGTTLPGAWNCELDIPVLNSATPMGFGLARVWGISLAEIKQSSDLNGKNISIFGGMQKGLPLAKPQQSGLLVSGYIFQAFGNWIETDMTLDLVVAPGTSAGTSQNPGGIGTLDKPRNFTLNWPKGQPLQSALQQCLQTAFPGYTVNVNVSSQIVRPNDQIGYFPTLEQLSSYCAQVSTSVVKTANYPGVSIVLNGTTVTAQDGSNTSGQATQIAFEDMIGQPTWLDGGTISLKTVMRADLAVGTPITLPPAQITNTALANSSLINLSATFQGGFNVTSLRHIGNFRQASADSWVTVIEAAPTNGAIGFGQGFLG